MELVFPYRGLRPTIVVCVRDCLSKNEYLYQMLLDTGADKTCFPGKAANFFGHDNNHAAICAHPVHGIGGVSKGYPHSVQISLIDPEKSTSEKRIIAWSSKTKKATFVEKFDGQFGLIGREIMSQWKSVTFVFGANGGVITIHI